MTGFPGVHGDRIVCQRHGQRPLSICSVMDNECELYRFAGAVEHRSPQRIDRKTERMDYRMLDAGSA
ncbi:hypothetical protein VX037_18880 [Gordonia sp. Z-3]|uniref:hypothetical protein n=1 Tax=Gordonia sp. Z-3 TaxID=3115408 RepID=UPI002E2C08B9|nr:hypothetical protein [Gordonia sp. Z-3]MED5803093.1 hypothetical protein [Gordonia sp. Z-3]